MARRRRRHAGALAGVCVALAACGSSEPPAPAPATTPPATAPAATAPPATAPPATVPPTAATAAPTAPARSGGGTSTSSPFIGSIAVDPADGSLVIGTGPSLYSLDPGARRAEKVVGDLSTGQGSGQVSGNLVVRFAGPGALLASGHPAGGSLPDDLGLMRSTDAGRTWQSVSGLGAADYHQLAAVKDVVVAVKAGESAIQVSHDGGRTFAQRTPPAAPSDLAVDPANPGRWAISTVQGTFVSTNEGKTWRPQDAAAGVLLAWPASDALYVADGRGTVRVSHDGGRRWTRCGSLGGPPTELAAGRGGQLFAAVAGGRIRRSSDGGAHWSTLVTLR